MNLKNLNSMSLACLLILLLNVSKPSATQGQVSQQNHPVIEPDAASLINDFIQSWDESAWEKEFRTTPEKYMRAKSNDDWQMRMRTFQQLVQGKEESVDPLLNALESENVPVRVLSAQTLGFLGDQRALGKLLNVAQTDEHPTVRLYAIDSYGMLGGDAEELRPLLETEKNRDAKMHLNYAMERAGEKLNDEVVASLRKWDSAKMATAAVGEPAPDFNLETANGGKIALSDFKGKSAVVLVFIYGDT